MSNATFKKEERLSSKKLIDKLFSRGRIIQSYPIKAVWLSIDHSPFPAQVLFSVPKRKFKKASDRNRIKRQMREIYRNNKSMLYDHLKMNEQSVALAFLYTGNDLPQFTHISDKIILTLQRLAGEIVRTESKNNLP